MTSKKEKISLTANKKATKEFCTIFPEAYDQHLEKDVGKLPKVLADVYNYKCTLVTENKIECESKKNFNIKKLKKLPAIKKWGVYLSAILYIIKNAKKIDVLNLYHLSLGTKINSILYKTLNEKGIIYIKLDLNIQDEDAALKKPTRKKSAIREVASNWFNNRFFTSVNLCSAESKSALIIAIKRYPLLARKILTITNGLEVLKLNQNIEKIVNEKENLIICVGRIGAPEKNYELLLEALKNTDILDWKIAFIGPYTSEFEKKFLALKESNPNLKDKIKLTGNISDRKELMKWYEKSKILAITSKREGFPSVIPEAQCNGLYILTTNISCAHEYVEEGKYGIVAENETEFREYLSKITQGNLYDDYIGITIAINSRKKYDWAENLKILAERIKHQ